MPSDKRRPAIPTWRQDAASAPQRKQEAQPAWRKEAAAPTRATGQWSRKTKIGIGAGAFFLFNALLVWVIYWLWPPKPACLVLIGAGYEENLAVPHNVYGWESLNGLSELSRGGAGSFLGWGSALLRLKYDPKELKTGDEWDKGLDDFPERTLLIYLALHGGADSQGPYLLYHDTDFRDDSQRLRVSRVIERLGKIEEKKKKVLILDATQVPAHWPLGLLHNEFARGLRDLKEKVEKIPNLVVLSASDVEQRSWVSPEQRKSIFAHYLTEGLKGAADEPPTGDRNGRVDALELHQYVARNVERWTRANRDARQTPVLLGGEDRAREIELVVVKERTDSSEEDVPAYEIPKDLLEAWRTFQGLDEQAPSPKVYTPHLWRQYQDTLLRYEQLLRAGDRRKVKDLKTELSRLEEDMRRAQRLELHSTANTLAMPAALGLAAPWSDRDLSKHVNDLWKARTEEYDQRWEQIQKLAPDQRGRQLLRLRLTGLLLERAAEGPRENLEKTCALLKVIGVVGNQRPAEAHFAAMLLRDLDKKRFPPDDLVAQALRLRRLAENVALALKLDDPRGPAAKAAAHPYSEQVFPWIQQKLAEADDFRRRGEDRLFATENDSWARAREDLQKAQDRYEILRLDAERVRLALATRDEVLLTLPYYSRWLASRRTAEESDLRSLEELWKDVHYLVRLLESPRAERINDGVALNEFDVKPRSLTAQTDTVAKAFRALEADFQRRAADLSGAVLQSVWRDTDDALVVPRLDADLRMRLLNNAQETSRQFHRKTIAENVSDAPGVSEEKNSELARLQAQRHGRMALAVLGQRWFDDPAIFVGRAAEKHADVENRIRTFHTEERWWVSLSKAEEEVGLRWRRMPEEIGKLTDSSRKNNLKDAAAELASATRITRQLDGAGARFLTINPADEDRRLHVHDLLLWQAERTRHDHWFAEDPASEPYYIFSGILYVQDAQDLMKNRELSRQQQQQRLAAADKLARQLKEEAGDLQTSGPARVDVTSEPKIPIEFRLQANPKGWVPSGYPVVWLETGKFLQGSGGTGRRVLETGEKQAATTLAFEFRPELPPEPPRAPRVDKTSAVLKGVFRGQRIEKTTPIQLHRLPETIVYRQPVPLAAGIAVRAAPEVHDLFTPDKGAIAIVLDCSGSMLRSKGVEDYEKLRANYNKTTPCNFHEATQALRQMLTRIPKGPRVSITIFSHKIEGVDNQPNPNETIRLFRPPTVWDPAELPTLMDKLESLEPWNETPVVRAMWKAKEWGFAKDAKGFKTLVVLTDGEDNQFQKDQELHALHGTREIPKFINEEFKDFGVVINFVGFKVAAGEETRFRDQFKEPIEKLPLAGKFYTVNDAQKLAGVLQQALRQKMRFKIEREGAGFLPEMPEDGWDVSRNTESDRWVSVEPGPYIVRVQTNKILNQRIHLSKGDFLLISLNSDGLSYERILLGDDFLRWRPNQENSGWLLTVLQNQLMPDRALEMLVSLENRKDRSPKSGTLQQLRPRPGGVWLEVKPQGSDEPLAVRWGDAPGYAAPSWSLHVPAWPARAGAAEAAKPTLSAWWNWEEDPPRAATLRRAEASDFENAFKGHEPNIGSDAMDKVTIDSLTIEERDLETRPGVKEKVSCLVVRLNYPQKKPVWVQLEGLETQGQEHHFYMQAAKYTGIFWAVKRDAAQDKLKALHLISVDQFKKYPTTSRMELRCDDAPDSKPRPKSVPELIEVK